MRAWLERENRILDAGVDLGPRLLLLLAAIALVAVLVSPGSITMLML